MHVQWCLYRSDVRCGFLDRGFVVRIDISELDENIAIRQSKFGDYHAYVRDNHGEWLVLGPFFASVEQAEETAGAIWQELYAPREGEGVDDGC